ncbi:MAG: tyrosine recombinase [Bacteroidales bacterium]|nr:tyrosine recombinase [Candidatus Equimonas enterica]
MNYLDKYRLYLLLECGFSANTIEAYLRDVTRFLTWAEEGGLDALQVTLPHLHDYTWTLHECGLAASSLSRALSSIRSFYRYLTLEEYIAQDPTELLSNPKQGEHLPDVLTVAEVDAILSAIDLSQAEGQRDHAIIELLYCCGLRVSELCALTLDALYLDDGFLRITGKGSKERIVPIAPHAVEELRLWFAARGEIDIKAGEEDYVFVSARRGRHLSRITVFHNIKQYVAAAGIQKVVSPHTFRHTFATHLLEGGASIRAIQVMLGHERLRTTAVYTHLDRRYLREQVLAHFPRNKR